MPWNTYSRFFVRFASVALTSGGIGAHLPAPHFPELLRSCISLEHGGALYYPPSPANDVSAWGRG